MSDVDITTMRRPLMERAELVWHHWLHRVLQRGWAVTEGEVTESLEVKGHAYDSRNLLKKAPPRIVFPGCII